MYALQHPPHSLAPLTRNGPQRNLHILLASPRGRTLRGRGDGAYPVQLRRGHSLTHQVPILSQRVRITTRADKKGRHIPKGRACQGNDWLLESLRCHFRFAWNESKETCSLQTVAGIRPACDSELQVRDIPRSQSQSSANPPRSPLDTPITQQCRCAGQSSLSRPALSAQCLEWFEYHSVSERSGVTDVSLSLDRFKMRPFGIEESWENDVNSDFTWRKSSLNFERETDECVQE